MSLAQGQNAVMPGRLEPATSRSQVNHSTGFDEMRWTIILPEKQKSRIMYMSWIRISSEYYI